MANGGSSDQDLPKLESKYRKYYWTYDKIAFENDHNHNNNNGLNQNIVSNPSDNDKVCVGSNGGLGVDDFVRCAFSGCKSKAMALTSYCYNHILADSNQKLNRGCKAVLR
ncbi:INO80 complex subunit D-like [Senna tora]|uniref:INO80 complex subunit D-like n=1 Tax=Senna tora TaxID=362788 RepID=A0A834VXQ6_9FABA|nr:INO80 complex subunit D-like [Senna tora]